MKKYLYVKRFLDFVFACILLVVTLPILLAVAIAIKLESEGPALFLQKRVGKNGKIFCVYKFRTMLDKSKENYRFLTDYDRVTRVGSLLRRTSIDELPQLINILRGDMSFIGPRPLLAEYLPYYSKREMKRHDVLPGITGWAQVNGRNSLCWEDKFRYDLEYVEKISLKLDLVIMVLTIHRLIAQTDTERISIPDFDYERRNMKAL